MHGARSGAIEMEQETLNETEEKSLRSHASGSTEDVSRDMAEQEEIGSKSEVHKENMEHTGSDLRVCPTDSSSGVLTEETENNQIRGDTAGHHKKSYYADFKEQCKPWNAATMRLKVRGGMNKFQVLAEEEQSEDEHEISAISADSEASGGSVASEQRSFYKEFYSRKTIRGGAGGANATQNKKLTAALSAFSEVMKAFSEDGAEKSADDNNSINSVLQDIVAAVKTWEEKQPTKAEMREQLRKFHQRLEEHARKPAAADHHDTAKRQQSFYSEFAKNLRTNAANAETDGWSVKGKGKGKKGKSKSKADETLTKFDLKQHFSKRTIGSWQLIAKEVEGGKEPSAAIAVVDSESRIAELQEIAKAHKLTKNVILVAKKENKSEVDIENAKEILLPISGNLALVRARIATISGQPPDLEGVEPKKDKEEKPVKVLEKPTTLRIILDLQFCREEKRKKALLDQPHLALHHLLVKSGCSELRTHGWSLNDNVISGYATTNEEQAKELLGKSGEHGVFISRLRQDIVSLPPCTWVKQDDQETSFDYLLRVTQLAQKAEVPMTWRSGGGSYLGYQVADTLDRMHAWVAFGVPTFWGPQTFKQWLERNEWKIGESVKPPRGKYKSWAFQGYVPGEVGKQSYCYQTLAGQKVVHITIQRWKKQRKQEEESKKIQGVRWWSADDKDPIEDLCTAPTVKMSPDDIEPTLIDATMEESQNGKRTQEGGSNSSPAKKKSRAQKEEAAKLGGGSVGPHGTTLLDCGGSGDCGWRSIGVQLAYLNSQKSIEELSEQAEKLAITIKAKTVAFIKQNRSKWTKNWVADPATTELMEDGPVPQSAEQLIKAIERPKRWVCGLCLSSIALNQKATVVIWSYFGKNCKNHEKNTWQRIAVLKAGTGTYPIVPVVLHGGHYYALRLPSGKRSFPMEWGEVDIEQDIPVTQEVDDEHLKDINCVLRGGMLHFTPVKRKKCEDECENLLRSFSTVRRTPILEKHQEDDCEHLLRAFSSGKTKATKAVWRCPVCEMEFDITNRQKAAQKVGHHMRSLHTCEWQRRREERLKWRDGKRVPSGLGLKHFIKPISFIKWNKKDERSFFFKCAFCGKGLPKFTDNDKLSVKQQAISRMSKMMHIKAECHQIKDSDMTVRSFTTASRKSFPDFYAVKYRALRLANSKRKMNQQIKIAEDNGHEPVVLNVAMSSFLRKSIVCKICRKCLNAKRSKCLGHSSRSRKSGPCAPGPAFWREAKKQRRVEEACQQLEISKDEFRKIEIAGRRWKEWCKPRTICRSTKH